MDIYRAVLRASGRPIAIGLLIGLAISITTWSVMAPLLRDVEFAMNVLDPGVYARTAILLASVALAAMLIPEKSVGTPRAENAEYLMAIGIGGSLDQALQRATTEMARWLEGDYPNRR
jgi:hypothetical protein